MILIFVANTFHQPDDEGCIIECEDDLKGKFNSYADPSLQAEASQLCCDKPPCTTAKSQSDDQGRVGDINQYYFIVYDIF